jgi:acyl-CoA synthetase (AMP-forming)/AMP-acid ligase II
MAASTTAGDTSVPLLDQTIGANLEATAARFPDREALVSVHQGVRMTYAEFDAEIDRMARRMLHDGLQIGDRVGIWAPNCAEWVLVQYATAKIGVILVNINPAYRTHEVEYALDQSGCRWLVAAPSFKTSDYVAMVNEVSGNRAEPCSGCCSSAPTTGRVGSPPTAGRPDAELRTRWRRCRRRPDQHPVHERAPPASRRAPRSATATSSTTASSSARGAGTPSTTGCASRCPSTTASAW